MISNNIKAKAVYNVEKIVRNEYVINNCGSRIKIMNLKGNEKYEYEFSEIKQKT